ncbi:hypothetical protein RRG08_024932 [Elysia crispata]|uniref:LITAF domain-containing protein n=1 Tax=Elysia crispata TaxID=231223 RepID=A0AAE1D9C2_9GAST|nr:hypothetical protein RRG08_024932 [Elysia crispata]
MTQPTVAFVQQQFGDIPVRCRCPNCHADILTKIYFESGSFTWVLCIILFILLGFVLPCLCFIPFCMDGAKDVIHICPNCHQQIARYNHHSTAAAAPRDDIPTSKTTLALTLTLIVSCPDTPRRRLQLLDPDRILS